MGRPGVMQLRLRLREGRAGVSCTLFALVERSIGSVFGVGLGCDCLFSDRVYF